MIHLGDITKISGYDVPIVDCVIGGSPCQDLSVAGKRAGLDGERSGLFMEQIRIIKEMREKDGCNGRTGEFIRPRFMVWENVPGALSSNKGEDFKAVLEETAKIIDKDAVIPMPLKGKWSTSGAIVGDGWSIAWRILDAQFWGVPQRRRRITLIADFGGGCASEILFERKGLHGHPSQSRTERQATPIDAQRSSLADDREGEGFDGYNGCLTGNVSSTIGVNCGMTTGRNGVVVKATGFPLGFRPENVRLYDETATTLVVGTRAGFCNGVITLEPGIASREGGHIYEDVSGTLRANAGDNQMAVAYSIENHPADSRVNIDESGKVQTLTSRMGTGGGNVPMVMQPFCKSARAQTSEDATTWKPTDVANTLNSFDVGEARCNEVVVEAVDCYNQSLTGDKSPCLRSNSATDADHVPCVVMDRSAYNQGVNANIKLGIDEEGVAFSHIAKGPGAVAYLDTTHADDVVRVDDVVSPLQARDYKGGKAVICLQGNQIDQADTSVCNGSGWKEDSSYTLNTRDKHAVVYEHQPHYIVRRLTPMECERLQGFPDLWTDIGEYTDGKGKVKKTSDSARYKALGNSIALPPWKWVIKRLCSHYERDATMASLFDGIGGFPFLWEQINGKGSCLWASEIEDFPIAVTSKRIE